MLSRTRIAFIIVIIGIFLSACDDPEERLRAYMARGIEFFEAGDYEAARLELKNALQIDATNGDAYYYFGRIYDAKRNWPEALRAFSQAVDQSPDHLDANIRFGRYLVLTGDLPRALARAEHIVTVSQGKSAEGYALRASILLAQKQVEQAEADARKALEIDPASESATAALAGILRRKNMPEESIAVLADGIRLNPENAALRLAKIKFHLQLNQRQKAESETLELIKAFPEELGYRTNLRAALCRLEAT